MRSGLPRPRRLAWIITLPVVASIGFFSSSPAQADSGGVIKGYSGKCIDAQVSRQAELAACTGSPGQMWAADTDDRSLKISDKCLGVAGGAVVNGSKLLLEKCDGTDAQKWTFSDGEYVNVNSGKCIDVTDFGKDDGTRLQIWTCTFESNQRWSRPGAGIQADGPDGKHDKPGSGLAPAPAPAPVKNCGGDGETLFAVTPYLYTGWGNPPTPAKVMTATGVKAFTMAFMLDGGNCDPRWDGQRPLTDSQDKAAIDSVRSAGGDVMISFGGANGPWLEKSCDSAGALSSAYQKVIDAYKLKAIDIVFEGAPYNDGKVQQRVVEALTAVRKNNPSIFISITVSASTTGPDGSLINRAAKAGLMVNVWAAMTFDWGDTKGDQAQLTAKSTDGLMNRIKAAYNLSTDEAYRHAGISSMNGRTDENATVTLDNMRSIVSYAGQHHLGRLSMWSVNRDRKCAGGYTNDDTCSGVNQSDWAYTKILASYRG